MIGRLASALIAAIAALGLAQEVHAATSWQENTNSAARLHLASVGGELVAGLEVRLEPGWKTYWRSAGSTGLPPVIDVEGSENVVAAELSYPAPERFVAFGIAALGYADEVTFPLAVERADPSRGGRLTLAADLLVCGTVCIPERYQFDVAFPADVAFLPPAHSTPIADALARVPVPAADRGVGLSRLAATPYGALRVDLETSADAPAGLSGALLVAEVEAADPLMGLLREEPSGLLSATLAASQPVSTDPPVRLTIGSVLIAQDLTLRAIPSPSTPRPKTSE